LPSLCYGIAYFALPHFAFKDCDRLTAMFVEAPESVGPFLYSMACQVQKTEPVQAEGRQLRAHRGELDAAHEYFVLEYPSPPPFALPQTALTQSPPDHMPVLAPYFSAILRHRQTRAVSYYTLGQAPTRGGTTLRCVTPEGANCNPGPGPAPRLEEFLACLRKTACNRGR
jgi:hypothetical protein